MSNIENTQQQQASPSTLGSNNKFKDYLIQKLLNESPNLQKSITVNPDDRDDVQSETGTYTIEDDLIQNKKKLDLVTARAEIDEKFGIIRPEISDENVKTVTTPRRQTQTIRVRNQTYSLANDIIEQSQNISCTSSETSSSHSLTKLPKTITYNVISENSNPDTSRTIATNVLLGDTDNLIKELKKTRTLTQINTNPEILSSSSASSSSTNLSNDNIKPKMWTIPTSISPIPTSNKTNLDCVSTRATVNFDGDEELPQTPKQKTGGLAFEFSLNSENNFVAKNLRKPESDILRSSNNESVLTLTKGFELRKNRKDLSNSITSNSTCNSQVNTPKSNAPSGLSLGARIQEKAKENVNSPPKRRGSDSTTPNSNNVQYTNRTLYLRQQSAKAKRDSLDKTEEISKNVEKPVKPIVKPKEGILKKTPGSSTSRNSSLNRSQMGQKNNVKSNSTKKTSRNVSPCESPLMTGSLNLPSGSSLPVSLNDSFQRRKMYDPLKSVQADKLKRQKEVDNNKNSKIIVNNCDYNEFDCSMSDSSYNSLPHQQIDNSNQTYEKILQSTLQRLCIRLIQMSTGVLDKIGDNRSNLCDSIQCLNGCSDLERMQILTKLVYNMQMVHDNMQIIDQTLLNQKVEDNYIKELTRIRQEVDFLKQSACLNSPNQSMRSSVLNNSFEEN
ncbi:unnamed protein product [Brachionus calyciflorus]|uniref:Uncharacterized protein n=1 Tax=Brachionus calyciflorus TaxID=104777 RepID=A0A813S8C6_9BILA|nr:unnamed protein product [Brachionus calyciflorus]